MIDGEMMEKERVLELLDSITREIAEIQRIIRPPKKEKEKDYFAP